MICPHCGSTDVPDNSVECPRCGKLLGSARAEEPRRAEAAPAPARSPWIAAGVLAALLALVIVVFVLTRRSGESVTQAPAAQPPIGPPITAAPEPRAPDVGPPVTQAPSAQPPNVQAPPPDPNRAAVEAYLSRVGLIERQRQQLVTNITPLLIEITILKMGLENPLLGPMADLLEPDPEMARTAREKASDDSAARVQQTLDGYVNQLRALDGQLRQITPVPQPAIPFARAYDEALARYAGSIVQIGQILAAGMSDPSQAGAQAQKLSAMKSGLQLQAQQGLQNADAQLDALTRQYGLAKPFDVTDSPRGTVTGL